MGDMEMECVYHGDRWRSSLQAVCNQLRGRYIPNKLLPRVRKVVCPCNNIHQDNQEDQGIQSIQDDQGKNKSNIDDDMFPQLPCEQLAQWFEECIFNELEHGLLSVEPVLKRMLDTLSPGPQHSSRRRFLSLVRCAVLGDLAMLQCNDIMTKRDKKLNYKFECELEIDIPRAYVSFLIGTNGRNIQPICKQYNCEINIITCRQFSGRGPQSGRRSRESPIKSVIKINSAQDLERVKEVLIEKAAVVTAKRKVHDAKVAKYLQVGNKLMEQRLLRMRIRREEELHTKGAVPGSSHSFLVAADELKEGNRERFGVKSMHQDRRHKPVKVLEVGSRCLNCLAPLNEMKEKEMEECRFHPGYLIPASQPKDRAWSCCGEIVSSEQGKYEQRSSHAASGCHTAACHNWRPTKNTSKRSRKISREQEE